MLLEVNLRLENKFLKIGVTRETNFPGEHQFIENLFKKAEIDFLHVRKPSFSEKELALFLEKFDENILKHIKIHDHFQLVKCFNIGGVHLNSRNPECRFDVNSLSISLHQPIWPENPERFDYMFLSPIYDSISKKGYKSAFDLEKLSPLIKGKRIIALGGVSPDKFRELQQAGFLGAAMSGFLWK